MLKNIIHYNFEGSLHEVQRHDLVQSLFICSDKEEILHFILKKIPLKDQIRCHIFFRSCDESSDYVVKKMQSALGSDNWRSLSQKHFHRLNPEQNLHDETINSFFFLLSSLDIKLCEVDKSRRLSHFFSSEFTYSKVTFCL